ncbi:hypothetical protein SAMN05421821_101446 [Mucilaginibacter lappiensis]|uniref:Uncharacterized protein n=1 Tax=Mucilaginibacter lappiensis TaxID=354630 RepID=A0ABR6PCZ3_9SPHI|nr:hypothetical protein [Mucilaginibacter lappiensis]SIQ02122.1 hypothetical protein SAMN05421821_101446 [Mucilaginibacter lappiensis]
MEESCRKPTTCGFIKRFLPHAVTVWSIINIYSWLEYIYKVKFDLAYIVNLDGSFVSFAASVINHNINQQLILLVLLIAASL